METPKMPPPPPGLAVKEIEIFTTDQLNVLPEEAKTSIVALEANLPKKELLVLNPLVLKLLKVKELAKLKYVPLPKEPTKEDIETHKANIEEFKEAKKEIAALKKQNGEAKSAIKKPIDLLGSQVLTIEKSINSIIVDVLTDLEKTFKPYIDAETEKARIAKEKKDAKANEAINTLSAQNLAQANTFKKSQLTTFLKYEMLEETKTEVNNAIENYSIDKLFTLRDSLPLKTFESFTVGKELDLFDETELQSIKDVFKKEMDLFKTNINTKITALQLEKTNEKLADVVEQQTEQLNALPPPPPPPSMGAFDSPDNFQLTPGPSAPPPPIPSGTPISNTNVFDVMTNHANTPFGQGASKETVKVELYPSNSNEVDFLDLVIAQIDNCTNNIEYIRKRFSEDENIVRSEEDLKNIERVRGAKFLLEKTVQYILNQLPPAEQKR